MDFFKTVVLGNSIESWMTALVVLVATFLALLGLNKYIIKRLSNHLATYGLWWATGVQRIAESTRSILLFSVALYVALQFLSLPPKTSVFLDRTIFVVFVVQLILWANLAFTLWVDHYLEKKLAVDAARATTLRALFFVLRVVLVAIILLWALDNLGVNITTLVAGLGVGGIAIALAVQNVLGDLLASFTIVLDKPFVLGDFIVIGDFQGTVEYIGIKTTRLRSLGGEQLIFPNADLLQSRIRNFKRMKERRVVFSIGVTYQTTVEQLKRIPTILKEAIQTTPNTRFDRSHFTTFGDSSLNFETVYFVLSAEFNESADIQQTINLKLFERFASEQIEFAFPTRTMLVQNIDQKSNDDEALTSPAG